MRPHWPQAGGDTWRQASALPPCHRATFCRPGGVRGPEPGKLRSLQTSSGEEADTAENDGGLDAELSVLTGCSEGGLQQSGTSAGQSRGTAGCLPGENSVSKVLRSRRRRGWS